jgi:anaerobic selenocysteine-containing dehydrogenase
VTGGGELITFCRVCHAYCGMRAEVASGRLVRVHGDPLNPVSRGFTCAKGRSLPEQRADPGRLLTATKRQPDGTVQPIRSTAALDEVAALTGRLLAEHGPRSVALYADTHTLLAHGVGADVIDEAEFFLGLARRLGIELRLRGRPIDLDRPPDIDTLIEITCSRARVPLAQVKAAPHGLTEEMSQLPVVAPPDPGSEPARLVVGDPELLAELSAVIAERRSTPDAPDTYRLIVSRDVRFYNSTGPGRLRRQGETIGPTLSIHPSDAHVLGIGGGETERIISDRGSAVAQAVLTSTLPTGVVAMTYGIGDPRSDPEAQLQAGSVP